MFFVFLGKNFKMPQKITMILLVLFNLFIGQAQDFSVFTIPNKLSKNANAVVNYHEQTIELVRQDKMLIHHKASITIYNKKADYLAELTLNYDNNSRVKNVSMEFFNLAGKRIKKVKKKDFDDYSATGNATLYSDSRVLYYHYTATTYPYTVKYEYDFQTSNTAQIQSWYPIISYHVGLKESSYSFTYPPDFKIQKLESNFEGYTIKKTATAGNLSYHISNVEPIKHEHLSPNFSKIVPNVKLASNKFNLAGVDGTADNWKDFGKWMYNELLASRNNLSEETKDKIKRLVKDVSDPIEKAKLIYKYVQDKTRYISVQYEIGGWQPMLTNDVDKLGYGDCKALTYYTKALMDVVEIPSFYSIVYADVYESKKNIQKEVVSVQGNHAFLCLPREKDTIWLECTSQKTPFGLKNSFTDDRDVLAITEEGGKIIHTNSYKANEILQKTTATISLLDNGSIQGNAEIKSYGKQYSQHMHRYEGLAPDDLEKKMKMHYSHINNLNFSKIEVNNNKDQKRYEENIAFSADSYAVKNSDGSFIFNLNVLNRISYVPDRVRNRKNPFEILRGFKDEDSYEINIPATFKIIDLPQPTTIENQFGIYQVSVERKSATSIQYTRTLLLYKGLYKKELYPDYRKFWKRINRLENSKIIIYKL